MCRGGTAQLMKMKVEHSRVRRGGKQGEESVLALTGVGGESTTASCDMNHCDNTLSTYWIIEEQVASFR